MNEKSIGNYLTRLLLFLIPLWVILGIYFLLDPFKVVREYDSYYENGKPSFVALDNDYVSTMVFEKTNLNCHYNSYILGSSRSRFYPIAEWKKYIGEDCYCYHFDASGETLYGVYKKIKYLDNRSELKNVLLVVDHELLEVIQRKTTHLNYLSPQLDGHYWDFQLAFIKAFFSPDMLSAFIYLKITGKVMEWAQKKYILDGRPMNYQLIGNEMSFGNFEDLINNGKYYTGERMKAFPARNILKQRFSKRIISEQHLKLLVEIFDILKKHNTKYKVVVSPLFDQLKINSADLDVLKRIFGTNNVYDFSGINTYTNDYRNYYENSHYRPLVAIDIMKRVYNSKMPVNSVSLGN